MTVCGNIFYSAFLHYYTMKLTSFHYLLVILSAHITDIPDYYVNITATSLKNIPYLAFILIKPFDIIS